MNLIKEFEAKKRVYLKNKRQYSKKSNKEREQKIKAFLKFCENIGIERIKDINQNHYRQFVENFFIGKSVETKRKYLYILREFFERAHLSISVNITANISRTKQRKFEKLIEILSINKENISEEQKNKIFEIL